MKRYGMLKLLGFVLTCAMLAPAAAMAQDDVPSDPLDREFDLYWAEKREVRNIHKRLFLKESRHEFSLYFGVVPNDDFFTYLPLGLKYDYYFSEDFAIEVAGSYFFKFNRDLKDFLETEILTGGQIDVQLPQYLVWQAGAGVLWTPFHGKVGIFDTKLGHFDFGFFLGIMALGTEVEKEGVSETEGRVDVGGNVGATVRFYVHDYIALRLDYRHYFYNARDADDNSRGLSYPMELTFGVSFFTAAPE